MDIGHESHYFYVVSLEILAVLLEQKESDKSTISSQNRKKSSRRQLYYWGIQGVSVYRSPSMYAVRNLRPEDTLV